MHCIPFGGQATDIDRLETLKAVLEPVFGSAEDCNRDENVLRFHPIAHRIRRRNSNVRHGDWAEFHDGRLD